ncbi:MAG: DUF6883 domain-containing protein [Steroidobacteraceae bacterium]
MLLNAVAAIVPAEKLRDYLLSSAHPIGRYKSAFFRSLGYAPEHWQVLERDLRGVLSSEAQPSPGTEYGRKFTVRGALTGPNGRAGRIVSVWIILTGETAPRFVTAYPEA